MAKKPSKKKSVKIKDLGPMDMAVKSVGTTFQVNQNGRQFGQCIISGTKLTWCLGQVTKANGVAVTWDELSEILSSTETKKVALKAARAA